MTEVVVDGSPLVPAQVVAVADREATAVPSPDLEERLAPARRVVEDAVAGGETIYGITTGLGALANTRIPPDESAELQVSLLRGHAAAVGEPLSPRVVRAMLLLRARTLAQGHSGVRAEVVERLLDLLRLDLLPVVPDQGSVGASGDLAQFAHLSLPLIGEGELWDGDRRRPAGPVLEDHGLAPLRLEPKEGLSLLNGTEGMLSLGVLGGAAAHRLAVAADIACALSVEALLASSRPFEAKVHALRPHAGQAASAANLAALLDGSEIVASHRDDMTHAVQDAYSLRCAPQVHGAVRDVLTHADDVYRVELGSVVDNPLVFPDDRDVVSAGNFHGQPLAFALDFTTIAVTELGSISERRTDRLLDPERSSGLPPFLAGRPGRDSGYMLAQYTAAALVAESRVLSHPASVESIPTSGSQEDHVSMGWGAGRKLHQVLDAVTRVLAVEVLCATEGIRHRRPLAPGAGTGAAADRIAADIPPMTEDRAIGGEIEHVAEVVSSGELQRAAESAVGALR